ncbi:MAG TPA: response regulator transcription factor [Acidimicrobiales bacterium]|nr:response regulator transcription factor [Acidimicrobiales bacterium]
MQIAFGPVPVASARQWITDARTVLRKVRAAGGSLPVELPIDVEEAFVGYLDEWEERAGRADPFEWSADLDVEHARHLLVYFFSLLSLDDETWAAHDLPFTTPVAQPFIDALSDAVLTALAAVDTEVAPSIKASWPERSIDRPWRADPGERFRVVIVDDTEDVRLLLGMTLNIDGRFDLVGTATNGREAITVCREAQPDGVLLDVMMPVLDGIDTLPELRAACPRSRIVMLSANDHPDIVSRARQGGADDFVTKGAPLEDVLDALLRS